MVDNKPRILRGKISRDLFIILADVRCIGGLSVLLGPEMCR